jgi:hypothetical protein
MPKAAEVIGRVDQSSDLDKYGSTETRTAQQSIQTDIRVKDLLIQPPVTPTYFRVGK